MPFKALNLHPSLVQATRDQGYTEPTPIQAKAIPAILAGRDLIATAQTGTGKTAAFLLPILTQILGLPRRSLHAMVISPTRELAQQINDVCKELAGRAPIRVGLFVGGASKFAQEKMLKTGIEIVIATPGRLLDHMHFNQAPFDRLHTLVLDEADRMLDMGFLPDLRRIVARLPGRKQTLLFSATMPPVIVDLARDILSKPETIQIGKRSAPAVGITQAAYPVPDHLKTPLLRHLLRSMDMPSVLVFTRTRRTAHSLARVIESDGFTVSELHSDRTQGQRTRALDGFRKGDFQVMVATNIAARGLDVDHITHVISHDVPDVPEDYVHRIGRTARAKAEGDAFVLVSPGEEWNLSQIERQIGQRLPRVTLPEFDYTQKAPDRGPKAKGRPPGRSQAPPERSSRSGGRFPDPKRGAPRGRRD